MRMSYLKSCDMSFKNFSFRDHSFFLATHTETYHHLQYGNLPGKEYETNNGTIKAAVKKNVGFTLMNFVLQDV